MCKTVNLISHQVSPACLHQIFDDTEFLSCWEDAILVLEAIEGDDVCHLRERAKLQGLDDPLLLQLSQLLQCEAEQLAIDFLVMLT